jgi:peptidoglycan hydrolase-like protein with peptidoglycan-binding domain
MRTVVGALKRIPRTAAATVLAPSVVLLGMAVAPTTAQASTPQCTHSGYVYDTDGSLANVPLSAGGSINCWMAQGDSSSAVRAMQQALITCEGVSVGSSGADGNYGPQTKQGVINFQTVEDVGGAGLAKDGVYGPATRSWMNFVTLSGHCGYVG